MFGSEYHVCTISVLLLVGLRKAHHGLLCVYCRWRAHIILSRLPQESWPEMQLKCAAYEALNKRRANWGYDRTWLGDYLAQVKEICYSRLTRVYIVYLSK